jgi:hypothetical protein
MSRGSCTYSREIQLNFLDLKNNTHIYLYIIYIFELPYFFFASLTPTKPKPIYTNLFSYFILSNPKLKCKSSSLKCCDHHHYLLTCFLYYVVRLPAFFSLGRISLFMSLSLSVNLSRVSLCRGLY